MNSNSKDIKEGLLIALQTWPQHVFCLPGFHIMDCIGQAVQCGQPCSTCLGNECRDFVSFSIACLAPPPALSLSDVKVFSDSFQLSHERALYCFSAQLMSELSFLTSHCCRCIGHLYIDRVVKFVKSHDSLSFHPGMCSELWNSLVSPVCGGEGEVEEMTIKSPQSWRVATSRCNDLFHFTFLGC